MISRGQAVAAFLTVILTTMAASFLPPFADWIDAAANNVYQYPGADIHFDYFAGSFMGLLCGIFLLAGPFRDDLRATLLFGWAVKLTAALIIMPIYEYGYGLDIDGYFMIYDWPPARAIRFGEGTGNIRLLAWWMFKMIGPNFHAGKVLFTFAGYMGIYLAYRGAVLFLKGESPLLLLVTTLSPTGLFWSSILGKDPICLFGVGVYAYGSLGWLTKGRRLSLIIAIAGAIIAAYIRSYFLPILSVPLTVAFFIQTRRALTRAVLLPLILTGAYYSLTSFQRSMKVDSFETFTKYQSAMSVNWRGGSSFELPTIDSPAMLVLVAPLGAFTALFRPMLFEAHNPFALAAALDNTVLLVLAIYAFVRSRLREFLQPELVWMSAFVLLWSTMYGLGSGNLGALSRFKIQVLPSFITLLLFMSRKRHPAGTSGESA